MSQPLTLSHITYTYPAQSEPTLSDVSVTFSPSWTAILGDNGIGKSTLARIAIGLLTPDRGNVTPKPSSLVVAYCPQSIAEPPANLEDFAGDWSQLAVSLRQTLRLEEDWLYRYHSLSGGQAKRVHIACALVQQADVVVLDEPTNHCDAPTRQVIAEALQQVSCTGLLISHDTELIDATARACAVFERVHREGRNVTVVNTYTGNYSAVRSQLDQKYASQEEALGEHQQRIRSLRASQQRSFEKVQRVESQKTSGARKIDARDHDARNAHNLAKATSLDAKTTQSYAQFHVKLQSLERDASAIETAAKRYSGQLSYEQSFSTFSQILHIPEGVLPVDQAQNNPLQEHESAFALQQISTLHCDANRWHLSAPEDQNAPDQAVLAIKLPNISVGPRDHIAISGANGLGKSTILRALCAANERSATPVPALVLPQTVSADEVNAALERLRKLEKQEQSQVLSNLAQLNADPDTVLAGNAISPGEARKLLLCLGLLNSPQLLILDEPTNHLDISSAESLAHALHDFPGAIIVASHNSSFLEKCI